MKLKETYCICGCLFGGTLLVPLKEGQKELNHFIGLGL